MPCLAQEFHPKLPAANHYCKSLSSLIRETYAHCHVPCVRVPAGAGWSSGEDSDDDSGLDEALETKQVILNEMRNRQMKKRSRCSMDSPTLPLSSSAFAWSYTPLDPRTVLEKASSPQTCVLLMEGGAAAAAAEEEEAGDDDGGGGECDADDESEAFFSVKSFFSRSTSRAATVASSGGCVAMMDPPPPALRPPEAWERFRDCEGWPFGLCRRAAVPPLPPLPSTPADSWKWRKSVVTAASPRASPAPAYYTHRITTASK